MFCGQHEETEENHVDPESKENEKGLEETPSRDVCDSNSHPSEADSPAMDSQRYSGEGGV